LENSRSNVLFINHSVRDGGPGKSLFYILKFLDRNQVNPFVLIPKDDIFSENLIANCMYENIIVDTRFPENLFRPMSKWEFASRLSERNVLFRKLLKFIYALCNIVLMTHLVLTSGSIIRSNKIDVIYCNGTIAKIIGALIGYFNKCKVIWHVRNIQQTRILSLIINHLSRLNNVKRIICVSKATSYQFRYSKSKLKVIYNGLDPEQYNPVNTTGLLREEFGIDSDTIIIGSTGRLVPRKGYEAFVKHTPYIFKKIGKDTRVVFVIIGDTPHFFHMDYKKHLENICDSMGLKDRFIFTGYRKEIRPYLKDMDIFFIPSNYPDPFPRTVVEAMSFSLPVVGFRIGGIAEAFINAESGYMSESGDYSDMMNNIVDLVANSKLRKDIGEKARKRVLENFNAQDIAGQIQDVILEVCKEGSFTQPGSE